MSSYDQYLSYTGFKTYVECPQRYYLTYVERKRPKIEDQRNVLNGNAMHNLLEEYVLRGENEPHYFIENIDRVWEETLAGCDHVVWRHNEDSADLLKKARGWAANLDGLMTKFDVAVCQPELKADTVVQVGPYKLKMGARLDIVIKNEYNDYMFFDLKASENRAVMAFDQIVWYAIVLGKYLGNDEQPKVGGYILPGFNEIKPYKIPEKAKNNLLVRLEEVLDRIAKGIWTPLPEDKSCYWCSVKFACPVKGKLLPHGNGLIQLG